MPMNITRAFKPQKLSCEVAEAQVTAAGALMDPELSLSQGLEQY